MGGIIKLNSVVGEGTTVTVVLPTRRTDFSDVSQREDGSAQATPNQSWWAAQKSPAAVPLTTAAEAAWKLMVSTEGIAGKPLDAISTEEIVEKMEALRARRCLTTAEAGPNAPYEVLHLHL